MTTEELTQTINKSIEELGFARIARPALIEVFSKGEPTAFDIHDELKGFAESHNLEIQDDADQDFVVFARTGEKAKATQ